MKNQQRLRSHRLRQSYRSDNLKFDYEEEEDLLPNMIVIESDHDPLAIESESDAPPPPLVQEKVVQSPASSSHHSPIKQDAFAEMQEKVEFDDCRQFQIKMQKNKPPVHEAQEHRTAPITYREYKTLIMRDFEAQKLEKAKLQQQEILKQQELERPMPIQNNQKPTLGDFMSKVVTDFDKKKRKRKQAPPGTKAPRSKPPPPPLDPYMEEMLKIYDEGNLCDVDALLQKNQIMKRALVAPPRFKDDFYFTHLYQDDEMSPQESRTIAAKKKKVGRHSQDTQMHFSTRATKPPPKERERGKVNPNTNRPAETQEKQIKQLQTYMVETLVGKRVVEDQTQYLCNFINGRRSWILQQFLQVDYTEQIMVFEGQLQQKHLETVVCEAIPHLRNVDSYCMVSHHISSRRPPKVAKIVFLKQKHTAVVEEECLAQEQEEVAKLFQSDRPRAEPLPKKKQADEDDDANFFERQFALKRNDKRKMKVQSREMEQFEEEMRMIEEDEQQNIQEELKRLSMRRRSTKDVKTR